MPECPHGMLDPEWCSLCKHPEKAVPHTSNCDDCGAEIMWVRTEKDKPMSIDIEPGGTDKHRFVKVRTERRADKIVGIVAYLSGRALEDNTRPLYACHFDTCTERKEKQT